jgi:ribonuclease HI
MPKKRKADALMQKFYAVRAGHTPGIYYTWQECQPQITGFRGAQCMCWLLHRALTLY